MKCVLLCVIVAVLAIQATKGEEFQCHPGVPYIENECNNCFCSEKGILGCTLKACPGPRYTELYNCVPGTTYVKDSCNRCWCDKKMGTVCSAKKC